MNSLPDIEEVKDKSIKKGSNAFRVYKMLSSLERSLKRGTCTCSTAALFTPGKTSLSVCRCFNVANPSILNNFNCVCLLIMNSTSFLTLPHFSVKSDGKHLLRATFKSCYILSTGLGLDLLQTSLAQV